MKDLRDSFLNHVCRRTGSTALPLRIRFWDGHEYDFSSNIRVVMDFRSATFLGRLLTGSTLDVLGEGYVEGDLGLEGRYQDILAVAEALGEAFPQPQKKSAMQFFVRGKHDRSSDAQSIRYHYDVSNDFYQLWLDRNMVYSCAYFHTGREDIDTAQEQKLDHICRKLHLQPGERFLDIGCGWGGLLSWAARNYGIQGVGVTLSEKQHAYATKRMESEGLADRIEIRLQDYRDIPERDHFDKVASIGMFEHVGLSQLPGYFSVIQKVLREGGWVLNHGITATQQDDENPLSGNAFIDRYVFPDGEIPHLWRVVHAMAGQNLEVLDVENLRPHYAQTLIQWVRRLEERKEEALRLVGPKSCRIWAIYMAGCAHAFWRNWLCLHQVLAIKQAGEKLAPRPWERCYQYAGEEGYIPAEPDWGNT